MTTATHNHGNHGAPLRFTVMAGGRPAPPPVLVNLLHDTSAPVLVYLAEQHGLRRVPGLSRDDLIARILRQLAPAQLAELQDDLIAARYGSLPVEDLLALALERDERQQGRRPRLDDMPAGEATLAEQEGSRWAYTMHGYDVVIDAGGRELSCECPYFQFAAGRGALCKHLARAFTLLPQAYAREALIDLLVSRDYGGPDTPRWYFSSPRAA